MAAFENGAKGRARANFLCDNMGAGWGGIAAEAIPGSAKSGGDAKGSRRLIGANHCEALIRNADHERCFLGVGVGNARARAQDEREEDAGERLPRPMPE